MRKKQSSNILVKQYINFYIREVVTEGFLPDFLEELFQVFNNKSEFDDKRTIVKKWILILLKSFKAYKDYSDLQESLDHVMAVKKVDKEIENTYVEKLKLNLDEIFIFAGCRVLPSSLKFPRSILARHLKSLSSDNKEICERFVVKFSNVFIFNVYY